MSNTAHALKQVDPVTPANSSTNTPEGFAKSFAELKSSAVFTNASRLALCLRWDSEAVAPVGGFRPDSVWSCFVETLRSLQDECIDNRNVDRTAKYSGLIHRAERLEKDVADWHDHVDDEREEEIRSWGTR